MTTDPIVPPDHKIIDSYYQATSPPNVEDLLHQRDVLAARNPDTPEWVLRKIVEGGDERVLAGVAANRACPHDLLGTIIKQCEHFDESWAVDYVRRALAANPFAPVQVIDDLLGANDEETRRAAAANLRASDEALGSAAQKDLSVAVRVAATANPNCPPPKASVVNEVDPRVRAAAALRRDTPPDVLGQLGMDDDPIVRRGVAGNPNTPPKTLIQLAADTQSDSVRATATANPTCPPAGKSIEGLLAN